MEKEISTIEELIELLDGIDQDGICVSIQIETEPRKKGGIA